MAHWYDQVLPAFVQDVANKYIIDNPMSVFDIFPQVNTNKLTGYIAKYSKADWLRIGTVTDYLRAGATESVGDDFAVTKQPYTVLEYSFHKDVCRDDYLEYDNPYDPINDAIAFCTQRLNRVLLSNLVAKYLPASGVWGTYDDNESSLEWDYISSSIYVVDPVADVLTAQQAVEKVTGFKPNRMIITPDVYKALRLNTFITNRLKATDDKVVTLGILAKLFDLDTITVLNAPNDVTGDSVTGAPTAYMATRSALLVYTPDRPTKFAPSAGYQLVYSPGGRTTVEVNRIPMPMLNDALRIELSIKVCPVVLASDLGYQFINTAL